MRVKGNSGRAARRRKMMNCIGWLYAVFCSLLAFLLLYQLMSIVCNYFLLGEIRFGGSDAGGGRNKWNRGSSLKNRLQRMRGSKQDDYNNNNNNNNGPNEEQIVEMILKGEISLVDIVPNQDALSRNREAKNMQQIDPDWDYAHLFKAQFCRLNWSSHERDPSTTPMFRDVIAASECGTSNDNPRLSFDLKQAVKGARKMDAAFRNKDDDDDDATIPHVLDLAGIVFHESRCGSTLVANLLQSLNPQENIVYSESGPPVTILRLADATEKARATVLSQAAAATVLQDVVYLMSRTTTVQKRRVFFKIQSIGTLSLPVVRRAFEKTPWVFVYRNPTEVLMSHLAQAGKRANCVQTQHRGSVPDRIHSVVQQYGGGGGGSNNPRDLSIEEYCAAHLATLTEMAAKELELLQEQGSTARGMAINYDELPEILWHEILPKVFDIHDISPQAQERMEEASKSYSKGRGSKAHATFEGDSQRKQETASTAIQQAARTFLEPSFQRLQMLAEQSKER